jgi:heme/copper-type cytochrome/quinol oxidase subunit 2
VPDSANPRQEPPKAARSQEEKRDRMKINFYITVLVIVGYVLILLISSHTAYRCRLFDSILTASAGPNIILECDEVANRET